MSWDNDGRPDLLVGEGDEGTPGRIRLYLDVGTARTVSPLLPHRFE